MRWSQPQPEPAVVIPDLRDGFIMVDVAADPVWFRFRCTRCAVVIEDTFTPLWTRVHLAWHERRGDGWT